MSVEIVRDILVHLSVTGIVFLQNLTGTGENFICNLSVHLNLTGMISTFLSLGQQKIVQFPTGTVTGTYVTVPVRQSVQIHNLS